VSKRPRVSRYNGLNKDQANALFALIEEAGADPRAFRLYPRPEGQVDCVAHVGTSCEFSIIFDQGGWNLAWTLPDSDGTPDSPTRDDAAPSWDWIARKFTEWVEGIWQWQQEFDRQTALGDQWELMEETLEAESEVASLSQVERDDPFEPGERLRIAQTLEEIRQTLLETIDASDERWVLIDSRLQYLEAAAEGQGRKAWLLMLTGTLATIAVEAALPPDTLRILFRIAFEGLRTIIGPAGPLALPPIA